MSIQIMYMIFLLNERCLSCGYKILELFFFPSDLFEMYTFEHLLKRLLSIHFQYGNVKLI